MRVDLATVTLAHGAHASPEQGMCAMEALACAMGLPHSDVPACTDPPLAVAFQRVNDWDGWSSDEDRTAFIRPYLMRLGELAIAGKRAPATAYGYAAADIACREFAPASLEAAGLVDQAASLRALPPIVDRATADRARKAAYATAYATDYAAVPDYAAKVATNAAAKAAAARASARPAPDYATDYAADAAYYTARASASAYRQHASRLLARLLDVCERGQ